MYYNCIYERFCSPTSVQCSTLNADITNSLLAKDDSYRNWPEFVPWFIGEIKVIALVAILHRFTSRCFCKICTFTKMCHSCRQPLQYTMASKPVTPCRTLSGHLCPVVSVSSSEHGQNFPKKKRTKTYRRHLD